MNNREIMAFLANRFPQCFFMTGTAHPLKIGIFQDLIDSLAADRCFSKTQLRIALHFYTSSWRYLSCLKQGATRIDLEARPCGIVDEKHASHAQQRLKNLKARARKKTDIPPGKHQAIKSPAIKPAVAQIKTPTPESLIKSATLHVGQKIKINIAKKETEVSVLAVSKESAKVQHPSGMTMIIRHTNL